MVHTPHEALTVLRSMADDGSLAALCEDLDVELLVVHGSVLRPEALRPPHDLDLAFRFTHGARADLLTVITAFIEVAGLDAVDVMDLQRAGDVARARALGPGSELLYEAAPSTYTLAQIAALTTEMESRPLRRRDLELMAGR